MICSSCAHHISLSPGLSLHLPLGVWHRALNGLLSFLLFGVTLSRTSAAGAALVTLSSVAYISWPSLASSLGPSFSDAGMGASVSHDSGGCCLSPAGRGTYAVLPVAAQEEGG